MQSIRVKIFIAIIKFELILFKIDAINYRKSRLNLIYSELRDGVTLFLLKSLNVNFVNPKNRFVVDCFVLKSETEN